MPNDLKDILSRFKEAICFWNGRACLNERLGNPPVVPTTSFPTVKLYKGPGSELIKLLAKPGEQQTVLLAGPMDDGCTPDQALYEKAIAAVKEKRFAVARLALCTLINTYPDSEYAGRAKLHFGEAKLRNCANTGWSSSVTNF